MLLIKKCTINKCAGKKQILINYQGFACMVLFLQNLQLITLHLIVNQKCEGAIKAMLTVCQEI